MTLAQLLADLLGLSSRWSLRASGLAFALIVPVCILALADWRVRARR